jgi:DNA-binding CsgD family transcriptional regulator
LTQREEQIVRLAADGQTSRAIASSLDISARTVDNHLAIAYQKLGVSTRNELKALAELR